MRCPKCGTDLKTEEYHGIEVNRCTVCNGVWLDAGETESISAKDHSAVSGFFKSLVRGVGG